MNPVIQEDVTGCGIACVAALAGVPYSHTKEVATRLGIQVTDSRLWSDTSFVRTLLKQYDIQAASREQPFRSWVTLPSLALLAIKWHRKGNQAFWHWVIFRRRTDRAEVLDPKPSLTKNIRTDFGRIKPKWFIPIASKNPFTVIPQPKGYKSREPSRPTH
jgi:ABC-type bacteriocin/lantibiotic exporter with double-glycine peptidase domain